MSSLTRKQRKNVIRIIVAIVVYAVCFVVSPKGLWGLIFLVPYLIAGYDVLKKAGLNIIHGQVFDENFLMTIATIGALIIGEYEEAVFVMIFYQVGELFQGIAVGKSRRSITQLMDISPEFARVKRDGEYVEIPPEEVNIGDVILVNPGEKIPIDAIILSGASSLDTAALTGESIPKDVSVGDNVISGCINLTSPLVIQTVKEYGMSTVAKILELVENSSTNKAKTENFITRFARVYTPVVVVLAAITAFVPPIFLGDFQAWIMKALSFLVVSCPCAIVISVPLAYFAGIGSAGRKGIMVKGSNYLEALANAEIIAFDKTGTLTHGRFEVTKVIGDAKKVIEYAAKCEAFSNHPIALSLKAAYNDEINLDNVTDVTEIAGRGVSGIVDKKRILVGNIRLMEDNNIKAQKVDEAGTAVYVACDGEFLGTAIVSDMIKDNAEADLAKLNSLGISEKVMLTGDTKKSAEAVAKEAGVERVYHSLLPEDKVSKLEELIAKKSPDKSVVYVGDGVNDAPVLKLADVGIAMGAMGSDAAIEAADIVLMDDKLSKLGEALRISKKTTRVVRQNIIFSIAVKVLIMVLTLLNVSNMWQAVFADVGVMVVAVLNSMRLLR